MNRRKTQSMTDQADHANGDAGAASGTVPLLDGVSTAVQAAEQLMKWMKQLQSHQLTVLENLLPAWNGVVASTVSPVPGSGKLGESGNDDLAAVVTQLSQRQLEATANLLSSQAALMWQLLEFMTPRPFGALPPSVMPMAVVVDAADAKAIFEGLRKNFEQAAQDWQAFWDRQKAGLQTP
ncbi:hypothetical protein [Azohydromonas aeria]|uniref:hypothetical protein n=1 Tax=Azohydromonas aeria TaxID=2590212 RepID=UPI0012F861B7|nr:hypothetical protein [Azohydromonas aeria]